MIVIGLGTGRSGTTSLAHLLCRQPQAIVFHEMNPAAMCFEGTKAPVLNSIREFEAILDGGDTSLLTVDLARQASQETYDDLCTRDKVSLIGDIAFYYLTYVEDIIAVSDRVRFICLKRDRAATIKSWLKKSRINRWRSKWLGDRFSAAIQRIPFYESKNFWMEHDASYWKPDPVWDKCFPKFDASSKQEAIGKYYDFYYEESEKLAAKYPNLFRIFSLEELNTEEGKTAILDFCGIQQEGRAMDDVWVHQIKD